MSMSAITQPGLFETLNISGIWALIQRMDTRRVKHHQCLHFGLCGLWVCENIEKVCFICLNHGGKITLLDLRFYLTRSLFPRQCFDNLSGLNVREFMGKEESDLVLFWHKIKLSGTPYQSGEVKKSLGRGNIKASKTANSIAIDVVLLTTLLEIILQCMCLTMNLHEPLKPCLMGLFHLGDWNLRENYQAGIHDVSDLFFFFLPFLFLYLESSVPFMPIRQWNCNAECLSVWEIPLEQTKLSKMEQTVCFVPDDKIISDIHFS